MTEEEFMFITVSNWRRLDVRVADQDLQHLPIFTLYKDIDGSVEMYRPSNNTYLTFDNKRQIKAMIAMLQMIEAEME